MYILAGILQLEHEISGFLEVPYKKDVCKTSQKSQVNTRSSNLEVFCLKENF